MNVCKWCMSGSATENSILLNVLPRLNKIFNQSINHGVDLHNINKWEESSHSISSPWRHPVIGEYAQRKSVHSYNITNAPVSK